MKVVTSKLPALQLWWSFGGLYFSTPDKLDTNAPFVKKEVRQAMSMAINRKEVADRFLLGRADPLRVVGYHRELDSAVWPGIWNPEWDKRFDELYGFNPTKAKALLAQAGYPDGFEFTMYLLSAAALPELPDIGEAVSSYWRAIGLRPKLVQTELSRLREQTRAKAMHGVSWGTAGGRIITTVYLGVYNKGKNSVQYVYEHPFIDGNLEQLDRVVDPGERARLLREIGDHKFAEFSEIPMFWLFAEVTINPKFIAEYAFPGTITGVYSHLEFVKLALQE